MVNLLRPLFWSFTKGRIPPLPTIQSWFCYPPPCLLDLPIITVRSIWPQCGGANRIASIPKAGGRTTPDNAAVFFTLRTQDTAKVLQSFFLWARSLGQADSIGTTYRRFLLGCGPFMLCYGRFMLGFGRFLLGSWSVLLGSCSVHVRFWSVLDGSGFSVRAPLYASRESFPLCSM